MPAKSQAQAHKIYMLYKEGKISKEKMEEFLKGVHVSALPEHVRSHAKKMQDHRKRGK